MKLKMYIAVHVLRARNNTYSRAVTREGLQTRRLSATGVHKELDRANQCKS